MIKHSRTLLLCMLGILLLVFAGCSQGGPDKTAEQFVRAILSNDMATLEDVVDPDYTDDALTGMMLTMGLEALVGGTNMELVELDVETVSQNGNQAVVAVEGSVRVSVLGIGMTVPMDMNLNLVKKGGKWYVTM